MSWCNAQACIGTFGTSNIWFGQMLMHGHSHAANLDWRDTLNGCHDAMRKPASVPLVPLSFDWLRCSCINIVVLQIDLAGNPQLMSWCTAQACIGAFNTTIICSARMLLHEYVHAANLIWLDTLNLCHDAMHEHASVPLALQPSDYLGCSGMNIIKLPIDLSRHPHWVSWCNAQAYISVLVP